MKKKVLKLREDVQLSDVIAVSRAGLFIVYFWFGALKLLGLSPAESLVTELFHSTLSWLLPFSVFYVGFSVFECVLGILFLIRGAEKLVFFLMIGHLFTTVLPLVFLPQFTWTSMFVLSLTGQYIVKNILIFSSGLLVYRTRTQK